jgi:iron complex outermembrane recepter protein
MRGRWRPLAGILVGLALLPHHGWGQDSAGADTPSSLGNAVLAHEISAQALPQALDAFARQTGLHLIYVSRLADGHRSGRAPAGLQLSAALDRILAGTGLQYQILNAQTVTILASAPALAKTAGPGPSDEVLTEMVVTATKRAEPLSMVPISVAVLSGDDIDSKGIRTFGDIAAQTPGLQFDFNSGFGPGLLSNISIRGISDIQGSPTIGIYIDDVPIQSTFSTFRNALPFTFDLDRVEVLRGPQGTLFGSSALNGAIRFISNEASTTQVSQFYHLEADDTEGGGPTFETGAAIGGPIVPGIVGGRVSAWYRSEGGYIDRVDPFNDQTVDPNANRSTQKMLRAGITFELGDSLRITPLVTYQSSDLHDAPTFYSYLSTPGDGIFRSGRLLRQPLRDTFALTSIKLQQRLGPVELTAISAYFNRSASAETDYTNAACATYFGTCGNPLGPAYPISYQQAVPDTLRQQQSAFSQELRIASAAQDARLSWLVGLFLWRTHLNEESDIFAIAAPGNPGVYNTSFFYGLEVSGFAQVSFALTPRWRIGVGTRNGWTRGDSTSVQGGFANIGVTPYSRTIGSFVPLPASPRFDVSYRANEDNVFYAALSKGARGGGANEPALCGRNSVPPAYSSDALWNYEIGAKQMLFERHLQLSSSVYYIRWDSIQEHVNDDCGNAYTTNAGAATSTGFDLAVEALPTPRLRLGLTLGRTDARYSRTVFTEGGQVIVERDTVIGAAPSVPSPWTGTIFAQYRQPLTADISAYASANDLVASHNSGPFTDSDPSAVGYAPAIRADPATNRLNLRLGVQGGALDIRLSLDNALNSTPVLHLDSDVNGSSLLYAYTFRPRTIGLVMSWKP